MKFVKRFKTETDYNSYITSDELILPNVSLIDEASEMSGEDSSVRFNSLKITPESDYEYVDLGLPSGTLWAKCNVGANNEYEVGDYFAWGEVEPKTSYTWNTYKWGSSQNNMTKYNLSDNKTILDLEDDAAFVNMGGSWRMPTYDELMELEENTIHLWISNYGLRELTSKINGSKLYIPSGGCCAGATIQVSGSGFWWSSSLFYLDNSRGPSHVYSSQLFPEIFVIKDSKADYNSVSIQGRSTGYNVRGVIKPNK